MIHEITLLNDNRSNGEIVQLFSLRSPLPSLSNSAISFQDSIHNHHAFHKSVTHSLSANEHRIVKDSGNDDATCQRLNVMHKEKQIDNVLDYAGSEQELRQSNNRLR